MNNTRTTRTFPISVQRAIERDSRIQVRALRYAYRDSQARNEYDDLRQFDHVIGGRRV